MRVSLTHAPEVCERVLDAKLFCLCLRRDYERGTAVGDDGAVVFGERLGDDARVENVVYGEWLLVHRVLFVGRVLTHRDGHRR